jgi:hypothetical protein
MPMPTAAKPTMAPTMECVVDTGQPLRDATSSQVGHQISIDDAFAYRRGNRATRQYRAQELEDRRDQDRLLYRQGFRADRCRHRVSDIVRANAPGHKNTEHSREPDIDDFCFHSCPVERMRPVFLFLV